MSTNPRIDTETVILNGQPYVRYRIAPRQTASFGRALDREPIQDAPKPPSKWRDIGIVWAGLALIWLALIVLFVSLRWALNALSVIG